MVFVKEMNMQSIVPTSWAPNFKIGKPNIIKRGHVFIKKSKSVPSQGFVEELKFMLPSLCVMKLEWFF